MKSKQPTKKRVFILALTTLAVGTFLISSWILLSEKVFVLVLVGGAILFSILEFFAFSRKKKGKHGEPNKR
jgi:hypothetical protein